MRRALTVLLILSCVCATPITNHVTTRNGPVLGNHRNETNRVLSFLDVPYAAPPTGAYRWTSPRPRAAWKVPYNATAFGNHCIEFDDDPIFISPGPQSEDCLSLSIWTAAEDTDEPRAVMVFIHGGGFQFGASSLPTYDGTVFAANGVVLVTINYRLGPLGFLALRDLDREGSNSGNYGIQDQIFALRWVKENIGAFGGDSSRVTVFGQSAGSVSTCLIISSQLARGAFDQGILESGSFGDGPRGSIQTFDEAREQGKLFPKALNVTTVSELRKVPLQEIIGVTSSNVQLGGAAALVPPYGPSIDRYVLTAAPATIWDAAEQAQVPLLAGFTSEEEVIFAGDALPHNSAAQFKQYLPLYFGKRTGDALTNPLLYPAYNDSQANKSALELVGDLIVREDTWEAGDTQFRQGNSVFLYYFTFSSPYSPVPIHTAELPYVFGNLYPASPYQGPPLFAPPGPADVALAKTMNAYWINFAATSNPNGPGLASWPEYKGGPGSFLGFGETVGKVKYSLNRFRFLKSFKQRGVFPRSWRSINVTEGNT